MCLSWLRKKEITGQLKNAFVGLQLQGFVTWTGFIKASEVVHAVVPGIADVSCLYCSASSHSRKVNVCCEENKLGNRFGFTGSTIHGRRLCLSFCRIKAREDSDCSAYLSELLMETKEHGSLK